MRSKPLLLQLIDSLQCLPGVGRKSAQRMAYHLLDKDRRSALGLSQVLENAMQNIGNCRACRDYTENDLCQLCQNDKRNSRLICIVESPADIAAIESTATFDGRYFVLMGSISPLDGIGPEEIGLNQLVEKVKTNYVTEVIVATSATVEGEATAHFIKAMLSNIGLNIVVSRLAQGVPIGGELEYLDSSTLSLSFTNRQSI
jgi:recombination protein RecR